MSILILLLLVSQQTLTKTPAPPSLIVQIVGPASDPLPGVEIRVKPLSAKGKPAVVYADKDGNAKLWLEENRDYSIEVKWPGFKTKRLKKVHLLKATTAAPTTYIKLQLDLAGPSTTVY